MALLGGLFLALAVTFVFQPASAGSLAAFAVNNPPFNYMDGDRVAGVATDVFLEMAKEAGIPLERTDIEMLPWKRAYRETLSNPDTLFFSVGRIASREDEFQWIGPLYDLRCVLVARKNRNVVISDLVRDSERYAIGTVSGSAPERLLLGKGVSPKRLQGTSNLELSLKKLHESRVDAILFSEPTIRFLSRQMGMDPNELEVVCVLDSVPLYYAANRKMDPSLVARLQKALDDISSSGRLQEMLGSYF